MNQPPPPTPPTSQPLAPIPAAPMFSPGAAAPQPYGGQHPVSAYPQAVAGYPGFAPGHGHPAQPYPQPINIVVQNTNTMTQGSGATGGLVRVANRNKWVAAALAFFLGGLGGHKFYLGQTGMGLVYLLFCWTFIPMFISLVETLMLVVADEREFDIRFNSRLM
jgi:TM2 domain-containing membrane protein YozV